jgi:hypothetical protein
MLTVIFVGSVVRGIVHAEEQGYYRRTSGFRSGLRPGDGKDGGGAQQGTRAVACARSIP